MEQLEFDFLQTRENYSINDFIVFSGNQEAFYFLNRENNDIVGVFFLIGERKSGKTYLANIWKNNVNAKFLDLNIFKLNSEKFNLKLLSIIENYDNYILEDVDFTKIEEEKIFHLMNIISLKNCNLLITTNININRYKFNLIDLKSLLVVALNTVSIANPEYVALQMEIVMNSYVKWVRNDKRNYRHLPSKKEYNEYRRALQEKRKLISLVD